MSTAKAVGYLILAIGVVWALYGSLWTPRLYDLDGASAMQIAQVASQATRIGVAGLAVAILGIGLIVGAEPAQAGADRAVTGSSESDRPTPMRR